MNSWKSFQNSVTQAASQAAGAASSLSASVDTRKIGTGFATFTQTVSTTYPLRLYNSQTRVCDWLYLGVACPGQGEDRRCCFRRYH